MMDDVARFPGVFVAKKKKRASDLGDSLAVIHVPSFQFSTVYDQGEDEGGRNSSFLSTQTEEVCLTKAFAHNSSLPFQKKNIHTVIISPL